MADLANFDRDFIPDFGRIPEPAAKMSPSTTPN